MAARAHVSVTADECFGDVEVMLKRLKSRCLKGLVFKESKKRAYYEKPGVKKRRKHAEALKRFRKTHAPSGELIGRLVADARRFGEA